MLQYVHTVRALLCCLLPAELAHILYVTGKVAYENMVNLTIWRTRPEPICALYSRVLLIKYFTQSPFNPCLSKTVHTKPWYHSYAQSSMSWNVAPYHNRFYKRQRIESFHFNPMLWVSGIQFISPRRVICLWWEPWRMWGFLLHVD